MNNVKERLAVGRALTRVLGSHDHSTVFAGSHYLPVALTDTMGYIFEMLAALDEGVTQVRLAYRDDAEWLSWVNVRLNWDAPDSPEAQGVTSDTEFGMLLELLKESQAEEKVYLIAPGVNAAVQNVDPRDKVAC